MRMSDEDLEVLESVQADRTDAELVVTLASRQKIVAPLWWHSRLMTAMPAERANYQLSPFGVHWPDVEEDLKIEGMLVGSRAPQALGDRRRLEGGATGRRT